MDELMGTIIMWSGTWAPQYWMFCNGQTLQINQYQALFSIIGTTYGGNGTTTFQLPDLRGRVPAGANMGIPPTTAPNLTLGQNGGEQSVTLQATQIPSHTHSLMVNSGEATTNVPTSAMTIAAPGAPSGRSSTPTYGFIASAANTALAPSSIGPNAGGSQPHDNMQPYMGINYLICVNGIYPTRP